MEEYLSAMGAVCLRLPRHGHIAMYLDWENDPATLVAFGLQFPQALSVRESGWDGQQRNPSFQLFEVALTADRTPIGLSTLIIDPRVRTAELSLVIGSDHRGRGYGQDALRATLRLAFEIASLEMVWGRALEPNAASVGSCLKAGFRVAGRLESAGWWYGRRCAETILQVTRDQYLAQPGRDAIDRE